jgi:hypothetical protein
MSSETSACWKRIFLIVGIILGVFFLAFKIYDHDRYLNHSKEVVEIQNRLSKGYSDLYGKSTLLDQAPQIEAWMGTVKGLTEEQSLQLFSGIAMAAPAAGLDRQEAIIKVKKQEAIVEAAAPLFPLFKYDPNFGRLLGKFSDLMPGLKPEQLVGVVIQARRLAGIHADKLYSDLSLEILRKLISAGMSQEEALANLIESYKHGDACTSALNDACNFALNPGEVIREEGQIDSSDFAEKTLSDRDIKIKLFEEHVKHLKAEKARKLQKDEELRQEQERKKQQRQINDDDSEEIKSQKRQLLEDDKAQRLQKAEEWEQDEKERNRQGNEMIRWNRQMSDEESKEDKDRLDKAIDWMHGGKIQGQIQDEEKSAWRNWTKSNGTAIGSARFDGVSSGIVKLKKKDGQTLKITLKQLCLEDRKWIQSRTLSKKN